LLQDGVGGTPKVDITTVSNNETSDLTVEIELSWVYQESFQLLIDLETIFGDEDTTGDLGNFAKNMVPGEGAAFLSLEGGVSFRLGVGLEYARNERKINPYIMGTTGFKSWFKVAGSLSYECQAGPFTGSIEVDFKAGGSEAEDDPLSLSVGLNESLNYYLFNPGTDRPGFVTVSGIGGLIDEVVVKFDGSVNAQIDAAISLIGTSISCKVGVSDLDALFRGDKTVLFLDYNVTTPE
jgi:hypothetical protein